MHASIFIFAYLAKPFLAKKRKHLQKNF